MLKQMPDTGTNWDDLKQDMINRGSGDAKWREGKTAVYVFNAGEDVAQVQKEAYTMYMSENGLGPMAFPSLKQMEDDVVGMGLSLLHGPENAAGSITSGGTDSINMAVKAARDFAIDQRGLKGRANIVAPYSAHPAFDKAAKMMSMELRRIPVREDLLADPEAMAAACDDTCVGGYIAPFVRMNGTDIPPFDFEVPGVKSMSADLHKYGYCAKGASTVLFRDEALKDYMIFDCDDWPGGRMITPTLAGTRPGGAISAAWAVMNYLGVEGYKAKHKQVTDAREVIEQGVTQLGFQVLGEPKLGLIAFSHAKHDIFAIYKQMYKRGWFTSLTTEPKALHLMLSPFHASVTDTYLSDLRDSVQAVAAGDKDAVTEVRYS